MLDVLKKEGWWKGKCDGHSLDDELIQIANHLGQPIGMRKKDIIVETLKPKCSKQAYENSLSANYELSAFPFHIDTAHWPIPCRYIVMGCKSPGSSSRHTLLVDWRSLHLNETELDMLKNAVFIIKDGRRSFFSSIIADNEPFIRYDLGCMNALNDESRIALQAINRALEGANITNVAWDKDDLLVIDNWRLMHSRGNPISTVDLSTDRELHRVLVK